MNIPVVRPFLADGPPPCSVCGEACDSRMVNPEDHPPLFRRPQVQSARRVTAPHRIIDKDLERVVYAPGQIMSDLDAVKYGIITQAELDETTAAQEPDISTQRVRAQSRARKAQHKEAVEPEQNRAVTPEENRAKNEGDAVSSGDRHPNAKVQLAATTGEGLEPEPELVDPNAKPKHYASKPEWVEYAVLQGMERSEAEKMSQKSLVEFYNEA